MITRNDLIIPEHIAGGIRMNGQLDAEAGIDMRQGWLRIAELCCFADEPTPARQLYEEGWHRGKKHNGRQ